MTTAGAASLSVAEGQGPVGERELAFMRRALSAAELAGGRGEVPVGAVVVVGDEIVSVAHNERETGGIRRRTRRSWRSVGRRRPSGAGGCSTPISSSRWSLARCARARW